jgi:hypothetical protein
VATACEAAYRRLIAALWVLVRTAGSNGPPAAVAAAAAACQQALVAASGDRPHLVVQDQNGALLVDGERIAPDVANFAAIAGCLGLMQRHGIGELTLLPHVAAGDLETLARCWNQAAHGAELEALLRAHACAGISVGVQAWHGEVLATTSPSALSAVPSQLSAVFTMQQFAGLLGPAGPLSGRRARAVLQAVLHGLLHSPRGLDPLVGARQGRDAIMSIDALRACVLAVRAAEDLGWRPERCIAAGTAALLGAADADTGVAVDPDTTGLARAARIVVAMLAAAERPETVIETLRQTGQLSGEIAAAMTTTLVTSSG